MLVRLLVPTLVASIGLGAVAIPMLRMRRTVGHTGFAAGSSRGWAARVVEGGLGALFAAAAAWAALVGVLGPHRLGADAPGGLVGAGVAIVLLGAWVVVTGQRQMGPSWRIGIDAAPTTLVARGLFARVRNPIYLGMMLIALGVTAMTPCTWTLACALSITVLLAAQARLEERHLARTHGAAYLAYAARIGRFLPGIGRLREE